eukprot:1146141-Pelagomonas_calceolata.AAC.3
MKERGPNVPQIINLILQGNRSAMLHYPYKQLLQSLISIQDLSTPAGGRLPKTSLGTTCPRSAGEAT